MKKSVHPIVYKCADFVFYLEKWRGINILHLTINRFSHNVFKKMCKAIEKLNKAYGDIYAYGPDKSTRRLLRMANFKETNILVKTTIGTIERLTKCHQQ